MLPTWDGSFLGEFDETVIKNISRRANEMYMILEIHEQVLCVVFEQLKDLLPCVIDNLKPIFGIHKRGTHHIKIGKSRYLFYYAPEATKTALGETKRLYYEPKLSSCEQTHSIRKDEKFILSVRKLLIFKELISVHCGEEAIIVRVVHNEQNMEPDYIPIGIREKKVIFMNEVQLNLKLRKKWFPKGDCGSGYHNRIEVGSYSQLLMEMIGFENDNWRVDLLQKMENVIKGVDSSYAWYSNYILTRIIKKVDSI